MSDLFFYGVWAVRRSPSPPLYRFVYKGDFKLNRYAQMLIENGMLVPVELDYEAAARAHAEYLGDVLPPRDDIYTEVRNILEAALGLGSRLEDDDE